MPARKTKPFEPWLSLEPQGTNKDKQFLRVTVPMLYSPQFTALHHSSQALYLFMAAEAAGKTTFEFPRSEYNRLGFSNDCFFAAKTELIKAGFITEESLKNLREKNKYTFCMDWKKKKADGRKKYKCKPK